MIEGLTALVTGDHKGRLAGSKFALPPGFPSHQMSSKWVENGPEVIEAGQDQILEFAGCKAQGWTVYKTVDRASLPKPLAKGEEAKPARMIEVTRVIGKRNYILLCRPKALQVAVNKIYSDQSRNIVNQEVRGETNAANTNGDDGILSNADLGKFRRDIDGEAEGYIPAIAGGKPTRVNEASTIDLH